VNPLKVPLTPLSRALLQKLIVAQLVTEISPFSAETHGSSPHFHRLTAGSWAINPHPKPHAALMFRILEGLSNVYISLKFPNSRCFMYFPPSRNISPVSCKHFITFSVNSRCHYTNRVNDMSFPVTSFISTYFVSLFIFQVYFLISVGIVRQANY
jgi:hypothetical protein